MHSIVESVGQHLFLKRFMRHLAAGRVRQNIDRPSSQEPAFAQIGDRPVKKSKIIHGNHDGAAKGWDMRRLLLSFRAAFGQSATFALLTAVILLVMAISCPQAQAGYWYSYHDSNCGSDGIACAIEDFNGYWGTNPGSEIDSCQYDYNYNGILVGAHCGGHTVGVGVGGFAGLQCYANEISSPSGCIAAPPPDQNNFCPANAGNPIDTRSGMKIESHLDFSTSGDASALKFERYYSSNRGTLAGAITSRLGQGWRSNFDSNLFSAPAQTSVVLPSGEAFLFTYSSSTSQFVQDYFDWTAKGLVAGNKGRVATLVQNATTLAYTLTTDDGTNWLYSSTGALQSITYQNEYTQTLTYDANGNNTLVTDSFGRTLQFTYTSQGLLATMTVPGGQVYQFSYAAKFDTSSNPNTPGPTASNMGPSFFALEYVTEPPLTTGAANLQIRYYYENTSFPFALTGIMDEAGIRYATWSYGADGRASSSQHAGGVDLYSLSYNDTANTVTVTNPLSKNTVYHFTTDARANNLLTQIEGQASTNCVASNSYIAYDSNNYITDLTDAEGRVTHFVRDSRGNPTTITRAYGTASAQSDTYTWHATLNVPTQAVWPNLTTNYTWTSGLLTQLTQTDTTSQTIPYSTNGQTRTWSYTYTTGGLLASVDGPLSGTGDTVHYTYNSSGFVSTVTNEVGQVTTATAWSGRGQPTSLTDSNGITWSLAYDGAGRALTVTVDPSGLNATTSITYDAAGNITRITRPNGSYLQYTYDNARRVTKVQDNSGAYISYTRDNMGNVTARQITDSSSTLQLSQTAVFDELGRLLKFIGASSQTWVHAYDKTDNRVSVTDPRSNVFGWSFDGLNRLISTTDEGSNAVTLTRNGKDEVTNYSDPRSLSTSFVRDGFGEVIQRVSPDSGTTTYTYNALGKPTQITDGRGVVANLTYDNAGRLLTKQYPAATSENVTYTWDSTTSGNKGIGRVTKIQDASGSITQAYNSLGQVVQEAKTTGSVTYTVSYSYDLDGNVTKITYPSGRIVNYYRGTNGLVTTVTEQLNSSGAENLLAKWVTYQPFGPLQSLSYGNNLILWKTFTQDYGINTLVVEQGSTSVINRGYSYWYGDFDITNIWDNNVTSRNENYVYTPNHWLQNDYGSWGETTYWQDGVGNRTAYLYNDNTTTTTTTLLYPYNNNHNVGATQGSTTTRTISYDGAGNAITDTRGSTTYHYRYNNRGRLDQLTIGSTVTASYTYDGLERMAVRTTQNMTPSGTTHYVYDRAGRLLMEASSTGTIQTEYVWLDDMPLALYANLDTSSPKMYYVHPDHLDRPTKMTDASQNVVWDAYYWPWGDVRSITGTATNNLRFPGQYFLVESGLHYNWHRHYDPSTGRYIQPDPNRDAIATQPVNLDGSTLTTNSGISGGSRLALSVATAGDFNRQIGLELPEFRDGASIFSYAKSNPVLYFDLLGLAADGPYSPANNNRVFLNACEEASYYCRYWATRQDDPSFSQLVCQDARRVCDQWLDRTPNPNGTDVSFPNGCFVRFRTGAAPRLLIPH